MKRILSVLIVVMGALTIQAQTTSVLKDEKAKETKVQTSEIPTSIKDLNQSEYVETDFDDIIVSYKGKVVYLDFWASWCRPCKGEMPYSLNLQQAYKDKDVVFVYISTDRNESAWKAAIDQLAITGQHYRVNKNVYMQMNEKFNVQYIPRYVLIDKEGNVVDANAKRPSNPEVKKDIDKLL